MRSIIIAICVCLIMFSPFSLICDYNFTGLHKFPELGWGAGNNTRGEKCIAIYGSNVYVGAEANGVSGTIQFYRSTDDGLSWTTLEEPGWSDSRYPSLGIDEGGRLYIIWFYHNATYTGLCKTGALYGDAFQCTGGGNTWIDWYSNLWFAGCPSISAKGNTEGNPLICASQESFDGTVYYEIVLDSPLDPMAWNNFNYWNGPPYHDHYMTYPTVQQIRPCIRLDDGDHAHLMWEDNRAGVCRLAFRRSSQVLSSGGPWPISWNTLVYIDDTGHNTKGSTNGYVQGHSQMVVRGTGSGAIDYVVWVSSDNNIYFDKSLDGGSNWGTDKRVNDNTSATREWPSIALDGSDNVYVVWMDDRDGNNNVYFSYSTDGGNTFSVDQCVQSGTANDKYPGIETGEGADALSEIHIAWTRVDTTVYTKGTPIPTGIGETDFFASQHEKGIMLQWETQGFFSGFIWAVYKRCKGNEAYRKIFRCNADSRKKTYSFLDRDAKQGYVYFYKLVLLNVNGGVEFENEICITYAFPREKLDLRVLLYPAMKVCFQYSINRANKKLSLRIYDVRGRLIRTFSKGDLLGSARIYWNCKDDRNRDISSGLYFAILCNGQEKKTLKFAFIR